MVRATGIGGVFFRVSDPEATVAWYQQHLGIEPEAGYPCAVMTWVGGETTVSAPFPADTEYFGASGQQHMVNYRVDDLDGMVDRLLAAGIELLDAREDADNGRFAWAVDCDGHRFELWQPADGH